MTQPAEEMLYVVDEDNRPLAPMARSEVHGHGIWHRTSHVWLVDGRGNVLCGQRSLTKDTSPGKWQSFFGGHLEPSENSRTAAVREVQEELGISFDEGYLVQRFINKRQHPTGQNNEFQTVFVAQWRGDVEQLHYQQEEIAQLKWLPLVEVEAVLRRHDPDWTDCGYEHVLVQWLIDTAKPQTSV